MPLAFTVARIYLLRNTLCGEFDQECVYGIAWQSNEFSGGTIEFIEHIAAGSAIQRPSNR